MSLYPARITRGCRPKSMWQWLVLSWLRKNEFRSVFQGCAKSVFKTSFVMPLIFVFHLIFCFILKSLHYSDLLDRWTAVFLPKKNLKSKLCRNRCVELISSSLTSYFSWQEDTRTVCCVCRHSRRCLSLVRAVFALSPAGLSMSERPGAHGHTALHPHSWCLLWASAQSQTNQHTC